MDRLTEENKSLEKLVLDTEKKTSDRTNIIIAANSFLLLPFATLVTSTSVTGWLIAIPILVCIAGIGLNSFLVLSNWKRIGNLKKSLEKSLETELMSTSFDAFFNINREVIEKASKDATGTSYEKIKAAVGKAELFDNFDKYAPYFMILIWGLCLVFFSIYAFLK